MQYTKIALTLWCILCCNWALAQQTNSGTVSDADDGQTLSAVVVKDLDQANVFVVSDSLGHFSINSLKGRLEFSHLGYENQTRYLAVGEVAKIKLKMSAFALDQSVITANRSASKLKDITISIESLQPNFIATKNPSQIESVMEQMSGINVADQQINIRSGSGWSYGAGTRVAILMDDVPLTSGDAGQALWSMISTGNIEQVEVVKGASSVLYGSSALSGVINIRSRWASEEPESQIMLFGGGYSSPKRKGLKWTDQNLLNNGLRISDRRKFGNNELVTSADLILDDGYRMSDHDKRGQVAINWRNHFKENAYWGIRARSLVSNSGSFLLWSGYDSAYSALDNSATENKNRRFTIDPFLTIIGKNGIEHRVKTRFLYINNIIDNGDSSVNQSNSSENAYAEYLMKVKKGKTDLTGGVAANFVWSHSPLYGGEHSSSNLSLFAQAERSFGGFKGVIGGRLEHYQLDDYVESKPVFRAGLSRGITRSTFLRASFGQGYRFPTIAESFITTRVGTVSIYPNENLRSETGWNAELGIRQGFKVKNSLSGLLDIALFEMQYQNMMEFTFGQWSSDNSIDNILGLGFKSINTGPTRIRGIDASLKGKYSKDDHELVFFGGITLTQTNSLEPKSVVAIDSTDRELTYINTSSNIDSPYYSLKYRHPVLFKLDLQYNFKSLSIGLSSRYNNAMTNIDAAFVDPLFSLFVPGIAESMEAHLEGNWVFDFRANYQISEKIRFGITVNNLLNEERLIRPSNIGPPRLSQAQLTYSF